MRLTLCYLALLCLAGCQQPTDLSRIESRLAALEADLTAAEKLAVENETNLVLANARLDGVLKNQREANDAFHDIYEKLIYLAEHTPLDSNQ